MLPTIAASTPREIAPKIETWGVTKVRRDTVRLLVLAVLAGACMALGARCFPLVGTRSALGFGVRRRLGGGACSLGLILGIGGGAALGTGNHLGAMAWAARRMTHAELLRHGVLVYGGKAVGALGTVLLVLLGQVHQVGDGAVRDTGLAIGHHQAALGVVAALALGGRSVTDKILALVFPRAALVTMGFEHAMAPMFCFPSAIAREGFGDAQLGGGTLRHLLVVTGGTLLGGPGLVAGVYGVASRRPNAATGQTR